MMSKLLRLLVRGYQLLFSHWINAGCRYSPSCSHYALQALDRLRATGAAYDCGCSRADVLAATLVASACATVAAVVLTEPIIAYE